MISHATINVSSLCGRSSVGERLLDTQDVAGSIPAGRTMRYVQFAQQIDDRFTVTHGQ